MINENVYQISILHKDFDWANGEASFHVIKRSRNKYIHVFYEKKFKFNV